MDCNKDEAMRAKDIALRKFTDRDFMGAKKFTLKAQTLYPGLDGISQMLSSIDVYISAENKAGGEPDLYGILGVNPMADDEAIKKNYRKLVLQLHPDKNKFVGADGAFRFVTDAYNVLSDKLKRSAYNTRRHVKIAQKVPSHPSHPRVPVPQPSVRPVDLKIPIPKSTSRKPYKSRKTQKGGCQEQSANAQSFPMDGETFWTGCAVCKMKYEYMRNYLGKLLKCPECKTGFVAEEIAPPSSLAPLRPRGATASERPAKKMRETNGISNKYGSSKWRPEVSTGGF
ncbi:uncharacterized protein LOC141618466 [Silene latifolia]|uniref:uncharacterized protein LOC141618466 n=1 Tax=Silene latifolia TaxID=37657 RepID=UPI003D778108